MTSLASANRAIDTGAIVSTEDQARADIYALIAALLLHAPQPALLAAIAVAPAMDDGPDDTASLAPAWNGLTRAAARIDAAAVAAEFDALFISVGTPSVSPHASRYLVGFLMEKPLAALRDDLAALGLARAAGQRELEDHLGALCEVMRLLIAGTARMPGRSLQTQRSFFLRHLAPWYGRCLDDLRQAGGTPFYRCVADLAQAFFEVEFQAFEMEDDWLDADDAFNPSCTFMPRRDI